MSITVVSGLITIDDVDEISNWDDGSNDKMKIHKETFFQPTDDGIPSHWVVQYFEEDMGNNLYAGYFDTLENAIIFEESMTANGDGESLNGIFMQAEEKTHPCRVYPAPEKEPVKFEDLKLKEQPCQLHGTITISADADVKFTNFQMFQVHMVKEPVYPDAWAGNCESFVSTESSLIDTINNKDNKSEKQ